jgi:hypothetical protein
VARAGAFFLHKQRIFWPRVGTLAIIVGAASAGVDLIIHKPHAVSTASTLPVLAFQIYFARYWLSIHSVQPNPLRPKRPLAYAPADVFPFVRYALLLALAFAVCVGPVGVVMLKALSELWGGHLNSASNTLTPESFILRSLLVGPLFLILICRLLLVFPARAAADPLTLRQSWLLARGITWRLFGTQLFCGILGLALFASALTVVWPLLSQFPSARLLGIAINSLAVSVSSAIYLAFATHCLAELYALRRPTRPVTAPS